MADNWADWYAGAMSPPLRLPNGGYAPAPLTSPSMSPEEMYRGIIPSVPSGLVSRSVTTIPITPRAPITADTTSRGGLGTGMRGSGVVSYQPPALPNQPRGSVSVAKDGSRLPAMSRDADILAGYAPLNSPSAASEAIASAMRPPIGVSGGGIAGRGAGAFGSGSLSIPRVPGASDGVLDLSALDLGDRGAQGMADSEGKPVRTKSGKIYYPAGRTPSAPRTGNAAAPMQRSRGLLGMLFGNNQSGGLFGGSGRAPVAITVRGGNPAPAAQAPTYTTTPFQEDRFQTTTGAQMPSSMNNSRWTTGY